MWQTSDVLPAFKAVTLTAHNYYHVTRPVTSSDSASCGWDVIISRHITNEKFSCIKFSTLECMEIHFKGSEDKIVAYLVYRLVGRIINKFFFVNFESLLI